MLMKLTPGGLLRQSSQLTSCLTASPGLEKLSWQFRSWDKRKNYHHIFLWASSNIQPFCLIDHWFPPGYLRHTFRKLIQKKFQNKKYPKNIIHQVFSWSCHEMSDSFRIETHLRTNRTRPCRIVVIRITRKCFVVQNRLLKKVSDFVSLRKRRWTLVVNYWDKSSFRQFSLLQLY